MDKKEEIREGMREHLKRFYTRCYGKEPEGIALDYLEHCLKNQEIWQASQGVVIKVERELADFFSKLMDAPKSTQRIVETPFDLFIYITGQYDCQQDMLNAGYTAWEPLTGEPFCRRCGAPIDSDISSNICGNCADDLRAERDAEMMENLNNKEEQQC